MSDGMATLRILAVVDEEGRYHAAGWSDGAHSCEEDVRGLLRDTIAEAREAEEDEVPAWGDCSQFVEITVRVPKPRPLAVAVTAERRSASTTAAANVVEYEAQRAEDETFLAAARPGKNGQAARPPATPERQKQVTVARETTPTEPAKPTKPAIRKQDPPLPDLPDLVRRPSASFTATRTDDVARHALKKLDSGEWVQSFLDAIDVLDGSVMASKLAINLGFTTKSVLALARSDVRFRVEPSGPGFRISRA